MKTDTTERIHHAFSPSTLQTREVCAKYQPRGGSSAAADRGTAQHKAAELGQDDNTLSDDEALAVAHCLDFIEQRKQAMPGCSEIKEAFLPIDERPLVHYGGAEKSTTAGYVDVVLLSPDEAYAEIIDHKFGAWAVDEAKSNAQGIAYTLGIFFKFPKVQRVKVFFIQPKLEWVTGHEFTRADEPALRLRVATIVARSVEAASNPEDFSMANPTTPGCLFCGLLGKCPKVAAFALQVGHKFHPLAVPASVTPTEVQSTKDTTLGLQLSQVLAVWAKAYRAQLTDRVIRGEAAMPPGYSLTTKADREVADAEKYKGVALRHITPEQFEKSCSVVFGKVESCIRDSAPRGSKKAAIETFNAELEAEGAVIKGDSYTFLKAVSDKKTE